jgi:hypothetical protein
MNTVFPTAVLAGAAAGLALPLVLALLSHGPWKVRAPGRRFVLAALVTAAGWALFLAARRADPPGDLLASAMVLLTAVLAGFTAWTLVAWGFTVSLLMRLAQAGRPLTFEEWVAAYTGGRAVDRFAEDRLSLLLRAGVARLEGGQVRLTPGRGRRLARLVALLRRLFGVHA